MKNTVFCNQKLRPTRSGCKSARLVRALKARLKLNNVQLATRMKVSAWTVWMWQAGVVSPSETHMAKLQKL